jgi:hypothetical protein
MASSITDLQLGKFLQIQYSDSITNQISEDFRSWEMIQRVKAGSAASRSINFLINKNYGAPSVKFRGTGEQNLPQGKQSSIEEGSAEFKQLYATIELDYELWDRAKSGAKQYLEPLAHEIQNKGIVQKRILSAALHLDGTGVMAEVASAAQAGANVVVTLKSGDSDRGGERYLEFGDEIVLAARTSTSALVSLTDSYAGNVVEVIEKDRDANTITVKGAATLDAAEFLADLVIYREGSTPVNLDDAANFDGTKEVDKLSDSLTGLESLTAKDGRRVHNLTLDGVYKGEHKDVAGAPVDINHLQQALDRAKTRNGQGMFKYKQILAAPETISAFIEAQEADRRLVANSDKERGFQGFCFVHGNDKLEMASDEFVGDKRMWIIPEGKAASGCLEMHNKDFQEINVGGTERLKVDAGGYTNVMQKHMYGYMTLICKRPGAIVKIHNFEN